MDENGNEMLALDIESLNRDVRQFIIEHCDPVSAEWGYLPLTRCKVTVLGHIDEIVGQLTDDVAVVGIVADEVDILPLELKSVIGREASGGGN
jgi:hypothetical protein